MKKLLIIVTVSIAAIFLATYYTLSYYRGSKEFTVNFDNIASVEVYKRTDNDPAKVATIDQSGSTIRIDVYSDLYYATYQGAEGYADGQIPIEAAATSIDIDPPYSESRLASEYSNQRPAIMQAITDKYPDLGELYDITNDQLYSHADWFGATLEYKGDSAFNRDNVGLIMQKTADKWQVISDPPLPSVNTHSYPDAPLSLIRSLNIQLDQ